MRYAQIRSIDVTNGEGIGASLFVQGCPHHCPGCFNQSTWNFLGGHLYTQETEKEIFSILKKYSDQYSFFSILGGEPLAPQNAFQVAALSKKIKEEFPNIKIYVWTGYLFEDLPKVLSSIVLRLLLDNIDFLIDGPFIQEKADITLKLRGSSNQRILEKGKDF